MKKIFFVIVCLMQGVMLPMQQSQVKPEEILPYIQQQDVQNPPQPPLTEVSLETWRDEVTHDAAVQKIEEGVEHLKQPEIVHVAPINRKSCLLAAAAGVGCGLVFMAIIIFSIAQEMRFK